MRYASNSYWPEAVVNPINDATCCAEQYTTQQNCYIIVGNPQVIDSLVFHSFFKNVIHKLPLLIPIQFLYYHVFINILIFYLNIGTFSFMHLNNKFVNNTTRWAQKTPFYVCFWRFFWRKNGRKDNWYNDIARRKRIPYGYPGVCGKFPPGWLIPLLVSKVLFSSNSSCAYGFANQPTSGRVG